MSVLVVLRDNKRYLVGCDTRISCSGEFLDGYNLVQKAKHINSNNEMIIGGVR